MTNLLLKSMGKILIWYYLNNNTVLKQKSKLIADISRIKITEVIS